MTEEKKDVQEKINRLSAMEQSLQSLLAQKQAFQSQLLEVTSAIEGLEKTDEAFKIIGNVMIKSNKEELNNDLEQKKEMLELRIKTLDKQEDSMRSKTEELQAEVMKEMH